MQTDTVRNDDCCVQVVNRNSHDAMSSAIQETINNNGGPTHFSGGDDDGDRARGDLKVTDLEKAKFKKHEVTHEDIFHCVDTSYDNHNLLPVVEAQLQRHIRRPSGGRR